MNHFILVKFAYECNYFTYGHLVRTFDRKNYRFFARIDVNILKEDGDTLSEHEMALEERSYRKQLGSTHETPPSG